MATIPTNIVSVVLKRLFDEQMEALRKAELATEAEITPLFPLLKKVCITHEGEGRIPFAIIPQRPALRIYERMTKVALNGNSGVTYICDDRRITNLVKRIPKGHYLMTGIEDGRGLLGAKPSVCLLQFERYGLLPSLACEGVTIATFYPKILRHHFFDLAGSLYDGNRFPCLFLNGGKPWLGAIYGDYSSKQYGSPSCEGRLRLSAY